MLLIIHQFYHPIALQSKDTNFEQVFSQKIVADIHLVEEHFTPEAGYKIAISDMYFTVYSQ